MRIRTRYSLFKAIAAVAIVLFLVSLYDMFGNQQAWFPYVMGGYLVLAVLALILYLGYKPDLSEEAAPAPAAAPMPDQDVVEEVVPTPAPAPKVPVNVAGPHHFRCPFCSNIFALELTHLRKQHELRMDCPFCTNTIRIPRNPKLSPGHGVNMTTVGADEQALFVCETCGEFLRYTAPGIRAEERVRVHTCPHCGSDMVDAAVGAAA